MVVKMNILLRKKSKSDYTNPLLQDLPNQVNAKLDHLLIYSEWSFSD